MSLQKQSYYSVSSSRAPIRNTADYSPFGIQLDGRTISYAPPAPAPPSVTVVYQHKFDDNPSTHPYTTAPNQLNTKLTNVSWTNSQSSWTNFAGFTGKAIATNSATPDTTRLYLNLTVNSGFMLDVKSYSFYHRSSTTGYTNYQLLVNGVLVGSGSIFVSSGTTLQSTGTINVANAIAGLTGSVTVTLKLFGGSNGNNATFRLDDFTLNGYTQEVQIYAEGYRYGFQNQEKDDEIKGAGNSLNYTFRMHDPRVGRFFVVDPLASIYPEASPYSFVGNCPTINREEDGRDYIVTTKLVKNKDGTYTKNVQVNAKYNVVDVTKNGKMSSSQFSTYPSKLSETIKDFTHSKIGNKKITATVVTINVELVYKEKIISIPPGENALFIVDAAKDMPGESVIGWGETSGNKAIVQYTKDTKLFLDVVKHEIGHNFGMLHVEGTNMSESAKGIRDYGLKAIKQLFWLTNQNVGTFSQKYGGNDNNSVKSFLDDYTTGGYKESKLKP